MYTQVPSPRARYRGMGDVSASDILGEVSSPLDSTGMSPLLMAGLGLLAVVFLVRRVGKPVKSYRKKRARRRATRAALKAQLASL